MSEFDPANRRVGLALSGGGITGAMYQVGCVAALEDGIEDFRTADVDVFVGSSTGATIATCLAAGLSAQRMYRALLDPSDDFFPLQRNHVARVDRSEWKRVGTTALSAARRLVSSVTSRFLQTNVWEELERFWDSLPAGVFTLDPFETFFAEFMLRRGIPPRFEQMPRKLVVVASDLDRGSRATFGLGDLAEIPVSRAVAACCAIPILYAPVRIDDRDYIEGGVGDNAHSDIAADAGCNLILIINPLVPIRTNPDEVTIPTGHGKKGRVRDKGLLWVYHQAWRSRTETRLRQGLSRFAAERPELRLALIEPEQEAATMFMYSPMNFSARRVILQDAYSSTLQKLKTEGSPLRTALLERGYRIKE